MGLPFFAIVTEFISHFGNKGLSLIKYPVMHVISKKTLSNFWAIHPDIEQVLKSWHKEVSQSTWLTPADIKVNHPSASFLAENRVVFNIKGNHYRLIVRINYDYGKVWIRFVGTHSAYDKIDAQTI